MNKGTIGVEFMVGVLMLAGAAALFFLAMKASNFATIDDGKDGYGISARFDNIGGLKVRAPVTMAGVRIGQVQVEAARRFRGGRQGRPARDDEAQPGNAVQALVRGHRARGQRRRVAAETVRERLEAVRAVIAEAGRDDVEIVGMVDLALKELDENNVVELDEERKASMVSNLLVVLCSDEAAQPVLNTSSLYT